MSVVKTSYQITAHAQCRWGERHSGDMLEALANSLPFGAQMGNDKYRKHEDAVFVIRSGKVITVLTVMQAMANMQSKGICFDAQLIMPSTPVVAETQVTVPKKLKKINAKSPQDTAVGRFLDTLRKADEDELAAMAVYSPHENFIKQWSRMKRRIREQIEFTASKDEECRKILEIVRRTFGDAARLAIIEELNKGKSSEVPA